jgi:hypothetical protein
VVERMLKAPPKPHVKPEKREKPPLHKAKKA